MLSSRQVVTGADCRVTEPLYHYMFDLSYLRKVGDHDYSVVAGEYTYLLNVCGPLNAAPACGEGSGACQTKPGSSISTGRQRQIQCGSEYTLHNCYVQ